jgi:leader peptidase (prepilin peptidase)/N-methyltransferase
MMLLALAGWPAAVVTGAFGALLGSFLNACIYRIPRGISIVHPPSACPRCGARIRPRDNVPVLGWLWLRGRCRDCREPISPRYPAVEALTAVVFGFLALRYGWTPELVPALVFAGAMIFVTWIDYDARIIPDAITLPGIALGLLASAVTPVTWVSAAAGAALGFLLLLGIAEGYRKLTGIDGMGGGDIKLAAMLGAFLGWPGLLLTLFLASLGGTLVGGAVMLLGKGGRRTALPFGTFLAPAALVVYVWGPGLLAWYAGFLRP